MGCTHMVDERELVCPDCVRECVHAAVAAAYEKAAQVAEDALAQCRTIGYCRCPIDIAAKLRELAK